MKTGVGNFLGWLLLAAILFINVLSGQTTFAAATPDITTQPVSQSMLAGTNVTFSVVATGQGTLFYQWSLNGTNLTNNTHINGATSTNLTINNLVASDAGNYQVTVTNSHGSITSSNATLTVLFPAAIATQPANQAVILTSNASFTVIASGTAPLAYQWQKNGVDLNNGGTISGAATATLNLAIVATNDAGAYQAVVTNSYGSVTSAVATLTVLVPAFITSQPTNQVVVVSGNASFMVTASGTAPLAYQWQKDGTNLADVGKLSGSASPSLIISNIQMKDVGSYRVVVGNIYGTASSVDASLSVVPVVEWGDNGGGKLIVPTTATNVLAIAAGYGHNLALRSDGTVVAWGSNNSGETDVPGGLGNIVAIAAGGANSLALRSDGTVVEWGNNFYGQTNPPSGLTDVVAIAAGVAHSLALQSNGKIVGWGDNTYGEATPPVGLSNVVAIAVGDYFSLALKNDGTVVGWGFNTSSQTTPPPGVTNVVSIAAGRTHSLALKSDGTVVSWSYGQPPPGSLTDVTGITAGDGDGLALTKSGSVVGWGFNGYGEASPPTGLSNVVSIAACGVHSLALVEDVSTHAPPPRSHGRTLLAEQFLRG